MKGGNLAATLDCALCVSLDGKNKLALLNEVWSWYEDYESAQGSYSVSGILPAFVTAMLVPKSLWGKNRLWSTVGSICRI